MINKLKKVYFRYKEIVWPTKPIEKAEPAELSKSALRDLLLVSGCYLLLYFFFFIVKYSTYQKYNDRVLVDLNAKNAGVFLRYLNTYPGNVIYIFISLVIFAVSMVLVSYLFSFFLETEKRKFSIHSAITLRAVASAFSVFPIVLIVNSVFPVSETSGKFATSLLVSSWIILAIASYVISIRCYIIDNENVYGQPRRRSGIVWTIPFYFVLNFMFGVIFN
ncbi:hypothetical protein EHQ23_07345 [Leptospira bourretii]|uniref:Yip1 domain-containing protein n=1 Tax=Leptospira bourretii TaxID=2484962 RepID=A0A4R9II54_9LEPT|nr:hypothetical protein [Leptospira bourretii]TGK87203.1 hypothetical protein EHQ23_07345 [Leptospira bourretii]TGK87663.1 hypothetical protein EHQ26_19470 [Leptospira bourretii]TGL43923.1 hypothetical protein EHQ45_00015 [Leptospira bourretii]